MPKLFQYQSRADAFPPVSAIGSGWWTVAPDFQPLRKRTDASTSDLPLLALPQPIFHDTSFTSVAPERMPKSRTDAGMSDLPYNKPLAAVAQSPLGWEVQGPDRALRRKVTDEGFKQDSYQLSPAPVAGYPLGWEGIGPPSAKREPVDTGWVDVPGNQPPAATAQNPLGWEGVGPDKARKIPVDAGKSEWPLNQPSAATAQNPVGWEAQGPPAAKKIPTQPGIADQFLGQPPAATAAVTVGWWLVFPDKSRKLQTDAGFIDQFLGQPAAATVAVTMGWVGNFTDKARKIPVDVGLVDNFLSYPQATPGVFKDGWQTFGPERIRKIPMPGGFADQFLGQPPAATSAVSVGFVANFTDKSPKIQTNIGFVDQFLGQPGAATRAVPLGWEGVGPDRAKKLQTAEGWRDQTLNQPPASTIQNPLGWAPVFTDGTRKQPAPTGTADFFFQPLLATVGWVAVFVDVTKKTRTDLGFADSPLAFIKPAIIFGWQTIVPDRSRSAQIAVVSSDLPLLQPPPPPLVFGGWASVALDSPIRKAAAPSGYVVEIFLPKPLLPPTQPVFLIKTSIVTRSDFTTSLVTEDAILVSVFSLALRGLDMIAPDVFIVTNYGVVNDGVTDVTVPLQNLVNSLATTGAVLYFPTGVYKISGTIDLSHMQCIAVKGSGWRSGSAFGSVVQGNVNGPLFQYLSGTFWFEGMTFKNTNATGTCLLFAGTAPGTSCTQCTVSQCQVSGNIGISATNNTFSLAIRNTCFNGSLSAFPNGIGMIAGGHTLIDCCDITGWNEGIRASGPCVTVVGCRLEVNGTALRLGVDVNNNTLILSRSMISGNSFEGNGIGIDAVSCNACVFSGMAMEGSAQPPPLNPSQIGVIVRAGSDLTFLAVNPAGAYTSAAFAILNPSNRVSLLNCDASNTVVAAKAWDVRVGLANVDFHNCNYQARPNDLVGSQFLQKHGTFQYLAQIDYLNPAVEGKNLRGKNIAVGTGNSSLAVVFTSDFSAGQAAINAATAVQTGGTLAAGTYYYLATAVTSHGETAGTGEKAVVVGSPNDSVNITFFGHTGDGWYRRVYRGTASGVYDGYFELPLNSTATFTDNGQAFTARRSPMSQGIDDTSMAEPDANYGVWVSPSWGTTFWITSKSTTGFTINFGTVAPPGGTVDWLIVR